MSNHPLTGEVSNSKLAAVFDTAAAAREAAEGLVQALALHPTQVKVVTPDEPDAAIKLEPEGRGIWRTIVVAHIRMGLFGAAAGAIAFAIMMWAALPFVVQSPVAAALVTIAFGGVGGLMLGGLIAMRPDHDRYVDAARSAIDAHRTTVLVHARSKDEQQRARELLTARGGAVTGTL